MKLIKPNKDAIKMSEAIPTIIVLRKFTTIPKNVVNTYSYMNELYLNSLN